MNRRTLKSDAVMMLLWRALLRDLYPSCKHVLPEELPLWLNSRSIPKLREWCAEATPFAYDVYTYKCVRQLKDFGKRYIFADDSMSDETRSMVSWENFLMTQERVAKPINIQILYASGLVRIWRRICRDILGPYDQAHALRSCKFAKNATLGHPARVSRLDQKVKGPLTGSRRQLKLFSSVLEEDPLLALSVKDSVLKEVDSLRLTFVPKSYKSLRAVMPDTLVGSFLTSGMGAYIADRLRLIGLDIRHLQARNRRLAMSASQPKIAGTANRLATLDLSAASDSLTPQLLRLLLPSDWYHAIEELRIRRFSFRDKTYALSSACTMGLGHTFPLQTLIFYTIVKGVLERYYPTWSQFCSVYGDDIICPSVAVRYIERIFGICHLKLNMDKSFWGLCDFRESCGGDYLRGIPVRPASPEGLHSELSREEVSSFTYRILNSLLERWEPEELDVTLSTGRAIINYCDGFCVSVPQHFPSDSGLKTGQPLLDTRSFISRVSCWGKIQPLLEVSDETIFAWDWLRSAEDRVSLSSSSSLLVRKRRRGRKLTYVVFGPDPSRVSVRSSKLTQTVTLGGC